MNTFVSALPLPRPLSLLSLLAGRFRRLAARCVVPSSAQTDRPFPFFGE